MADQTIADSTPMPGAAPVPGPAAAAAAAAGGNVSLYVGDLHPEVTEATLFEMFSKVGPLTTIRVCRDNVTRRSLGYAYVNFVNADNAKQALEDLNCEPIRGQPCRIMWSQRDPSIRRSNAGNVFIKNLHKDIDNKALLDTFGQFGQILSCKVKTDQSGLSLGYGFVHYETPEGANRAIETVNNKLLMGQKVFVGPFKSQAERLAEMGKNAARFTNVFIKNLPGNFTDDLLEVHFGKFGRITSRRVMVRQHEGMDKCIAFAAYENSEDAQAAVQAMHETELGGLKMYVARAQSKSERQALLRRDYERRRSDRQHQSKGVNLFVKNLELSIDDDRLRQIFSEYGTITSVVVMRDEKGLSKGFGFVCFSDSQEATNAQVHLNKRMIDTKPLYVALAQRKDERRQELAMQNNARMQTVRAAHMGMPGMYMPGMPSMMYMPGMQPARGYPYMARPRPGPYMPPAPFMQRPPAGQMQRGPATGPGQVPGHSQGGQRPSSGPRPVTAGGQPAPRGRGGPRPQQAGGQQAQLRSNVRNAPSQGMGMQQDMQPDAHGSDLLAQLGPLSEAEQKNALGERLYPLIERINPTEAGKITGMLIEMDVGDLLHLLEDPNSLQQKVDEALSILAEHQRSGN